MIGPVAMLAAIAALVAILEMAEPPGWLVWLPGWLIAALAAALGVAGTWWVERWVTRRQADADVENQAIMRLRVHLGRRTALPQIGQQGADALTLRVHDSNLSSPRPPGESCLTYFVERDVAPRLREWLSAAAVEGGFLCLVGNSSVGKTRLLYELAREMLPNFTVLAPDLGDGGLVNTVATATFPLPKTIIWIDELQRFLAGPYFIGREGGNSEPITASAVRKLLGADVPIVLLGTLWPEYLAQLRGVGEADRLHHPLAIDVLNQVNEFVRIEGFSANERAAAEAMADQDLRLGQALADPDFNVTEALAGAPQLMLRYELATREGQAVLHAAIDAWRVGIRTPVTAELLAAAARGYLASVQPDDQRFQVALADLTRSTGPNDGATAPLVVVADPQRRSAIGFLVADYLLQSIGERRYAETLNGTTWQAFIDYVTDPEDLLRLAESATHRLLLDVAEALYRSAFRHDYAGLRDLTRLLVLRGRPAEAVELFRARIDLATVPNETLFHYADALFEADCGDMAAAILHRCVTGEFTAAAVATRLVLHGRDDEAIDLLRPYVGTGTGFAAAQFWTLEVERGRLDALRAQAAGGDFAAALVAAEHGYPTDEAIEKLKESEASNILQLTRLLALNGRHDEAMEVLQRYADPEIGLLTSDLADQLAASGDLDRAIELMAPEAAKGYPPAIRQIAAFLADQGHVDDAVNLLTTIISDVNAAEQLAKLLRRYGRADQLKMLISAGTPHAAEQLIGLLSDEGNQVEADRLQTLGLHPES